MKVKVNLSLEQDTAETLKELAQFSHKTVSQWVTDKIWEEKDSRMFIAPGAAVKATDSKQLEDFVKNNYIPLRLSGLSPRAYVALENAGYMYTSEVRGISKKELLQIKGIGNKVAEEIIEKIGQE